MSRPLLILLIASYQSTVLGTFLFIASLSNFVAFSWVLLASVISVWTLANGITCLYYLCMGTWHLPVRKLISAEEKVLLPLLYSVLNQSNTGQDYQLLIMETMTIDAFATAPSKIVVSTGLLAFLNKEELLGVLAHETGHLRSGDCHLLLLATSFDSLFHLVYVLFRKVFYWMNAALPVMGPLLLTIFLIILLAAKSSFFAGFISLILLFLLPQVRSVYQFLHLLLMRKREYAQDAYASSLGYGKGLRSALNKFKEAGGNPISMSSISKQTHPIIHHRIRRLEKMEDGSIGGVVAGQ